MSLQLASPAFAAGAPIPQRYTGDGDDVSPPLSWSGVPRGTRNLVLLVEDPDAPTPQPWAHWVLYGLAGDVTWLPEGLPRTEHVARPECRQGTNSWGAESVGYRGPAPPRGHGRHRYFFRLLALDEVVDRPAGCSAAEIVGATRGHVLAEAELVGTYERA